MKLQKVESRADRNRGNGFTLVEMLVVIVIIAALAAIVTTVVYKIKARAYQATALSTLRQVGAFHMAYAAENAGDINTLRWVGDPKEGGPNKWASNSFWGRFQPYLLSESPSNDQKKLKTQLSQAIDTLLNTSDADTMVHSVIEKSKIYHDGSGLPVPLAFNQNLHKWNKFMKISEFGDSSRILYATYGFGFFSSKDGEAYKARPEDQSKPENKIYYLDDGKALAIYLDGHVGTRAAPMPAYLFE